MPHYRFNDPQVATLSGFLLAKSDSDLLANVHLDAATPEQIAHGKRLVSDYGCASCHEIAGIKKPENFAPELSRIGSKSITQLIFLPGMKNELRNRLAAYAAEFRSEVFRLLDSGDFVAGGAAIVGHQALAVRDLLGSRRVQVNVRQQIGIRLGEKESR